MKFNPAFCIKLYVLINILILPISYSQLNDLPENVKRQILESGLTVKQIEEVVKNRQDINNLDIQSDLIEKQSDKKDPIKEQQEIQQKLNIIQQTDGVVNDDLNEKNEIQNNEENIENDLTEESPEVEVQEIVENSDTLKYFG